MAWVQYPSRHFESEKISTYIIRLVRVILLVLESAILVLRILATVCKVPVHVSTASSAEITATIFIVRCSAAPLVIIRPSSILWSTVLRVIRGVTILPLGQRLLLHREGCSNFSHFEHQ